MRLSEEAIRNNLSTAVIGRSIVCHDVVDSTNEAAWGAAIGGGAEDGAIIFAEEQRAGRGRMGRRWSSPPGKSLLLSIVLRPRLTSDRASLVTAISALAVVDALKEACGLCPMVRFPNDVLIGDRKIAGILVESRFISNIADIFIVGIGVNVNAARDEFPADVRDTATSVFLEGGREFSRVILARRLIEAFDRWYGILLHGSANALSAAWRSVSMVIGRRVVVRENGGAIEGVVEDIDPVDGVILRTANGHIARLRGEHIEHLRIVG